MKENSAPRIQEAPQRLDLLDKSNWTVENAQEIADILGFDMSDKFVEVLNIFINDVVKEAKLTNFLCSNASMFFMRCGFIAKS